MRFIKFLAAAALGLGALSAQAEGTMTSVFGYCADPYQAVYFGESGKAAAAIELDATAISNFSGGKVTSILIANGVYQGTGATESPITVFVTNSLEGDPVATYETTMDFTAPFEYKEFVFPEAIEITAETESLFFGYIIEQRAKQYAFVVDYATTTGKGDYLAAEQDGALAWDRYASQVGQNCIRVKVEGESFGNMNKVGIAGASIPGWVKPGEEMEIGLTFQNLGLNDVSSVTVQYTVNNGEPKSTVIELSEPLHYKSTSSDAAVIRVQAPTEESASVPIKIEVTGVGAEAAANGAGYVQRVKSGTFHCFNEGFEKSVVAEIVTGTWCGYCPLGHHGVSEMGNYDTAGRFIPIAVHYNDDMECTSYSSLTSALMSSYGAPSARVNRNIGAYGTISPTYNNLKYIYDYEVTVPALVKPAVANITFDEAKKKLNVEATAEFAVGTTGDYAFAFVITEDEVGPYAQTNYYSPAYSSGMSLEWWDEQGPEVSMTFNNVARYIYSYNGIKNSIPETVEAGQTYSYTAAVATNTVDNLDNCSVVVMVINRSTSMIENAVKVKYDAESGIESVEAEINGEAPVYFDLQGRTVASPRQGQIYIERRGAESRKIRF